MFMAGSKKLSSFGKDRDQRVAPTADGGEACDFPHFLILKFDGRNFVPGALNNRLNRSLLFWTFCSSFYLLVSLNFIYIPKTVWICLGFIKLSFWMLT